MVSKSDFEKYKKLVSFKGGTLPKDGEERRKICSYT